MSTVTVVFCMAHPIRVGREYPRGIENYGASRAIENGAAAGPLQ
jgi:hypothetical protein